MTARQVKMLTQTQDNEEIIARIAALDIGKAELVCCVRVPDEDQPGRRLQEVETYSTMTRPLLGMADHLRCLGVTRVVMEATSDYWKPAFYLLEAAGFETWLVNARDVKHLPGRPKTDPLTELPGEVARVCGRMGGLVATVADHDHRRRCAAGPVPAGDAVGRVA
jgi:transposase